MVTPKLKVNYINDGVTNLSKAILILILSCPKNDDELSINNLRLNKRN